MSRYDDNERQKTVISYEFHCLRRAAQEKIEVSVDVEGLVATRQIVAEGRQVDGWVREALERFIPGAAWEFREFARRADTVGYERVQITAAARVAPGDAANLEERARRASSEGLSLSSAAVDRSIPRERLEEIYAEMRLEAIETVKRQQEEYRASLRQDLRIESLVFRRVDPRSPRAYDPSALRMELSRASPDDDDAAPMITTSQEIGLSVGVRLVAEAA